jgi:hypothetical protein
VGQQREKLNRMEVQRGRVRGKPGESARRRLGQRDAGRILYDDAPAPEFGGDAAGEVAIRRDQRGPAPRARQRFAQRDCNGERLFALVRRFDEGEPISPLPDRDLAHEGRQFHPEIGRVGRPHDLGHEPPTRLKGGVASPERAHGRTSRAHMLLDKAAQDELWVAVDAMPDPSPPMAPQPFSSRSRSRPGSTTAPRGRREIVASSRAVAGIEPVEPAAITGPIGG